MHDYSNCYATLGVTPDTDWVTLRARYKRLMGQWHPDRFSADAPGKAIAEERSKQITLAYKALEKYRRDHGALPPIEFAAADAHRPEADPEFRRASFWDRAETGTAGGIVLGRTQHKTRRRVCVGAVLFFLLLWLQPYVPPPDGTTAPHAVD